MPTTRRRHQVTETPAIEHALDLAARRWPNEPRTKLLMRLVQTGSEMLEREDGEETRRRRVAAERTSGKYAGVFPANYLAELRRDWSE
jgi:hypothetical protein